MTLVRILIAILCLGAVDWIHHPPAFAVTPPIESPDWVKHALRFTGESDYAREQAIKQLQKSKDLNNQLDRALTGTHRSLAIDVIVALKLKEFLPKLAEVALDDRDGSIHWAMYNLAEGDSRKLLINSLTKHLSASMPSRLSPAAKTAAMEMLTLWRSQVPLQDLLALLRDPSPEVRIAAVSFARASLLNVPASISHHDWVLERALKSEPYQVRVRTLFAVSDVTQKNSDLKSLKEKATTSCSIEASEPVKQVCSRLGFTP